VPSWWFAGARTLEMMTLNMMTLCMKTLCLNTHSIVSLNIRTLSIKLSIMTLTIMAFGTISATNLCIMTIIIAERQKKIIQNLCLRGGSKGRGHYL
jgi:hypothetical protein